MKDKRSLKEIQEEERARQAEEDFLKWWAEEEERVRLENEQVAAVLAGRADEGGVGHGQGAGARGKKQRKPRAEGKGKAPQNQAQGGEGGGGTASTKGGKGEGQRRASGQHQQAKRPSKPHNQPSGNSKNTSRVHVNQ